MQSLVIIGTGGSAHDVMDIVEAINAIEPAWKVRGFLDDSRAVNSEYMSLPVLGRLEDAEQFTDVLFVNCIGSDRSFRQRPEILERTGLSRDRFATLVHPKASVSSRARLGRGSYVNFGASVGGGVSLGDQVSVGPGVIIGHDCVIEDFVMLAPGAVISGFVQAGRCCYVGARAVIRQQLKLGERSLIGMGAVVTRDVPAGEVVAGIPARLLRSKIPV